MTNNYSIQYKPTINPYKVKSANGWEEIKKEYPVTLEYIRDRIYITSNKTLKPNEVFSIARKNGFIVKEIYNKKYCKTNHLLKEFRFTNEFYSYLKKRYHVYKCWT